MNAELPTMPTMPTTNTPTSNQPREVSRLAGDKTRAGASHQVTGTEDRESSASKVESGSEAEMLTNGAASTAAGSLESEQVPAVRVQPSTKQPPSPAGHMTASGARCGGEHRSGEQSMVPEQGSRGQQRHEVPVGRAREAKRLGLTLIERLAATAIVPDDQQLLGEIYELVRATAESLASEDRDAARVRLLARELAVQKNVLDLLTAQIGTRLQAGDEHGALIADRLATSAAKRLALLTAEHRASAALERRAIVAIANAAVVHVDGTK